MFRRNAPSPTLLIALLGIASWASGLAVGRADSTLRVHPTTRTLSFDATNMSGPPDSSSAPAFAYDACADKDEGTACSLSFEGHEIKGTCVLGLDERLFCLPDELPARRQETRAPLQF